MKFPRNVRIFRGQTDATPYVGVLFLLVLMVLMSSLVYTPGIPMYLDDDENGGGEIRRITVTRTGEVLFDGNVYGLDELVRLRGELKKLPPRQLVVLATEPDAPRELAAQVRKIARDFDLQVQTPGLPIELPEGGDFPGTSGARLFVTVNFGGQFFFENEMVSETALAARLEAAVRASRDRPVLVVRSDKAVEMAVTVRLTEIARAAGIREIWTAIRPRVEERRTGAGEP